MTTNPDISEKRKSLLSLTRWILISLGIALGCIIFAPFLMVFIMGGSAILTGQNSPIVGFLLLSFVLLTLISLPISCFVAAYFVKQKESFKPLIWPFLSILFALIVYSIMGGINYKF